jgi:hypothetical protein
VLSRFSPLKFIIIGLSDISTGLVIMQLQLHFRPLVHVEKMAQCKASVHGLTGE